MINFGKHNSLYQSHSINIYVICVQVQQKKLININNLIAENRKVKRIEKEIALTNSKKTISFTKKWHMTNNIVT